MAIVHLEPIPVLGALEGLAEGPHFFVRVELLEVVRAGTEEEDANHGELLWVIERRRQNPNPSEAVFNSWRRNGEVVCIRSWHSARKAG